jgi:hypothetical protein
MDRLAREWIVFDNVYSHAPLTLPSHAVASNARLTRSDA